MGKDISSISRPVEVSYGRGGMGATLTLLTTGANAPMLEMQKEQMRAKVNAVYGYNAIARVRITQTAGQGFAEGRALFDPAKPGTPEPVSTPEIRQQAVETASPVRDAGLRDALAQLGENILNKTNR
ncbi:hypothetical protein ROLI_037650 [Roseobacter fucihabitans]|uniref:Lipoprotein n=2 Tax=Roseobacter fucihabitans TaxID=1537242 RepID=A0ABZ2BZ84_9RHOB|nr:hypothetical protein [Roseobacter litoralis]